MEFNLQIFSFLRKWCLYTGGDLAETSRMQMNSNVCETRVMCFTWSEFPFVLKTFRQGADEILIYVCLPDDGQYCNFVSKSCPQQIELSETTTTLRRYLTENDIGTGLERKLNVSNLWEFDAIFLFAGIEILAWVILSELRLSTTSGGKSISDMAPVNIDYQKNIELSY